MPPFDFDQLREITREAARRMPPRLPGRAEGAGPDRESASGAFDDPAIDALLDELRRLRDCRALPPRPSPRKLTGPVVSFAKRVGFRLVRPFVQESFEAQSRFNEAAYELLSLLVEERRRADPTRAGEHGERPVA